MDLLHEVVVYLDDPYLVASFQKLCGLTLDTSGGAVTSGTPQTKTDDAIYGISGLSNPSIVFRDQDDPRMTCYEELNGQIIQKSDTDDDQNSSESSTSCVQRKPTSPEIKNEKDSSSVDAPVKTSHQNGDIPSTVQNKNPKMPPSSSSSKSSQVNCRLPYKINNKTLYYLFSFGAALGNELFYTTFFPFILWNVDAFISRKIIVIWWITLYVGQATKDILKRPRPISPPVIKLEGRYELEYGMPSTHAMVGTCIPFTLLLVAVTRYEFPLLLGIALATSWTILVSLSRIYLGMHSLLDVVAGILYVCIILPLMFPFLQDFDNFSVTHPLAPIFTIGVPFILCVCYPPVDKWNTARRDTTLLVGVAAGISVGSWLSYQYGLAVESPPIPYQIYSPNLMTIVLSFVRLLVGVPLMLLTGELLRPIVRHVTSHWLKMDLHDPKIKKMQVYELTDSFIPFLFVAINVTFGIPIVFKFLSIDRPEYYTELLIPGTA